MGVCGRVAASKQMGKNQSVRSTNSIFLQWKSKDGGEGRKGGCGGVTHLIHWRHCVCSSLCKKLRVHLQYSIQSFLWYYIDILLRTVDFF